MELRTQGQDANSTPGPSRLGCDVQRFSNTNLMVEVKNEGTVGFTNAIQLSKDWLPPGTWEKVGELEQTNTVSTTVLNLNTNLPPRVHFRLKWPP